MVIGDCGLVEGDKDFRKSLYIQGWSHEFLASLTLLRLTVRRPDGTGFNRDLIPGERDANGNFTWLIQDGELNQKGTYTLQVIGLTNNRQTGVCSITIDVCPLLAFIA